MDLTERAELAGVELVGVAEGRAGGIAVTPRRAFYLLGDGREGQARALASAILMRRGAALTRRAVAAIAADLLAEN